MYEDRNIQLQQFGVRLRNFRQNKELSQEKFAELTGLDRTYISSLERGKRNPSYLILKCLTEVLGITPNELFID